MVHTFDAGDVLREQPALPAVLAGTGLADLDALTGGIRAGDVWMVVGPPRSGRTYLTLQLAARLASAGTPVRCVLGADPAHEVVSRLRSASLTRSLRQCRTEPISGAGEAWTQWPIEFVPASEAHRAAPDMWRMLPRRDRAAMVIDDLDLLPGDPAGLARTVRSWAGSRLRAGVLALPAHLTLAQDAPSWQEWVRIADVIVAVEPVDAGRSHLHVASHRRGPVASIEVDPLFELATFRQAES